MAPRSVKIRHDDETRAKIKTSQLLNRLNDHIFKEVELSQTQMRAIEVLLRKTLPDLSAMEANLNLSGEITVRASKEQRDAAVRAALATTKS
jgi:hypothetical protein